MCGIVGVVNRTDTVDSRQLEQASDLIAHRGPDGKGVWISPDRRIGFGHRRLSILDLSEAGAQPMISKCENFSITFNGEIYNYLELKSELQEQGVVFRTETDTEVLLQMYIRYGVECLDHLEGMFAFAIYNRQKKELFCARDRFGEKPFFYSLNEKKMTFCSEMKGLFALGSSRVPNEAMIFQYLSFDLVESPSNSSETFYKEVHKLPPAHFLILSNDGTCNIQQYWDIDLHSQFTGSLADAEQQLRSIFDTSVSKRLRSDVPVGTSLSGGLDSSIIALTVADQLKNKGSFTTFSAVFPGFEKDESPYIKTICDSLQLANKQITPTEDSLLDDLDRLCYHQEEPFGSSSIYAQWKVMELARQNGVPVLLDGQGADEIAAGYKHYYHKHYSPMIYSDFFKWFEEMRAFKKLYGEFCISPIHISKSILNKNDQLKGKLNEQIKIRRAKSNGISPDFFKKFNEVPYPIEVFYDLKKDLHWNTMTSGLQSLLRYSDRNAMAHAIEVRLPFLDHNLVDFLFSLPADMKIKKAWRKYIFRTAFPRLPEEISWRKKKIGFEPPKSKWNEHARIKDQIENGRKEIQQRGYTADASKISPWKSLMFNRFLSDRK